MKKILLLLVGFILLITTTFAYNWSQIDADILQRVYKRVDFLYEEDPIKIEKFGKALSGIQEKYKNQERLSYLLEELSEYINKIMEKKDDELIIKKEMSNTFKINKNNILHLRDQNLDEDDVSSIAIMLQQLKNDNKSIESISFSYNPRIGDNWITRIMQSMPANVKIIGCVGCGINDAWGKKILEWMKRSSNLQMICIEQNNFSDNLKQQFNIFKKQNPHIIIII